MIDASLNLWRDKVIVSDTSLISNVKLISYPIEKTSLLSRRLPKRKRRIEYRINGKEHFVKLPINCSTRSVFDICQYDATRFLMSIRTSIDEIKYNRDQYYVVMIDLEDLSRRRFLGIKF